LLHILRAKFRGGGEGGDTKRLCIPFYMTIPSPKLKVSPLPDICFIYSPSNAALIREFSLIFFRQFPTPPFRTFPAYTPEDFFMLLMDDASTTFATISGVFPQSMNAATFAIAAEGSSIMSSYLRNRILGSSSEAAYHSSVWSNQLPAFATNGESR
jgi:hypothetical protein